MFGPAPTSRLLLCALIAGAIGCGDDSAPGADAGAIDARQLPVTVNSVEPAAGPFAGDTEVTVRGSGFIGDVEVSFGGIDVDPGQIEVIDGNQLRVRTPPGRPGPAEVAVRRIDADGQLVAGYYYYPVVLDPPSGPVEGGTRITVTGFGTAFDDQTEVVLGDYPLTAIEVVNAQRLTGLVPAGEPGTVAVTLSGAGDVPAMAGPFTYHEGPDPAAGGMGGGPIAGQVNVVVVNASTGAPLPGATVALGDPAVTPHLGTTDDQGAIIFSDAGLTGPVTASVGAPGFETTVVVEFDAGELLVALKPWIPTDPGPQPRPPRRGTVGGQLIFGAPGSGGSPTWDLVPDPRTPTEIKRVYLSATAASITAEPLAAVAVDFPGADPDVTAWPFDIPARSTVTAVVAVAGLYDPDLDPSGTGAAGFEPFAIGIARGVVVGPGAIVTGVEVAVDTPLSVDIDLQLDNPPALGTDGWDGPVEYTVRPFIDLGGEGVILMNEHGLVDPPPPQPPANLFRFADGQESAVLPSMAPLTGALAGASYAFVVGAYADGGQAPFSVRIAHGIRDVGAPVSIGDFLAMPRPVDPGPGQVASARAVELAGEPPPTGEETYTLHLVTNGFGEPLYKILVRGGVDRVKIPDLSGAGAPALPVDEDVSWTFYRVSVLGGRFDQLSYRDLSVSRFAAFAADAHWVRFP